LFLIAVERREVIEILESVTAVDDLGNVFNDVLASRSCGGVTSGFAPLLRRHRPRNCSTNAPTRATAVSTLGLPAPH
jgi:hypothetical protein